MITTVEEPWLGKLNEIVCVSSKKKYKLWTKGPQSNIKTLTREHYQIREEQNTVLRCMHRTGFCQLKTAEESVKLEDSVWQVLIPTLTLWNMIHLWILPQITEGLDGVWVYVDDQVMRLLTEQAWHQTGEDAREDTGAQTQLKQTQMSVQCQWNQVPGETSSFQLGFNQKR